MGGPSRTSFRSSFLVLATAAFGTGILSLPYALRNTGLLWGCFGLGVSALSTALACSYLAALTKQYRVFSYGSLVEAVARGWLREESTDARNTGYARLAGGCTCSPIQQHHDDGASGEWDDDEERGKQQRTLRVIMRSFDVLFYVYMTLEIIIYLLFLADFATELLALFVHPHVGASDDQDQRTLVIVVLALISWPLAMVPQLSKLRFLSEASLLGLFLVVLVILWKSFRAVSWTAPVYDGRSRWNYIRTHILASPLFRHATPLVLSCYS